MTRSASVAVIIPAFNAGAYLQVTLDSLKQQTVLPVQVIVVDDGSTDGTSAIAERNGVTCIRQERAGPGAARNRGIAAATTEYLAFLDADDWYALDKIERSLDQLRELGAACIATDAWLVRGDRVERRRNERQMLPTVMTTELLLSSNPIVLSSVVARREAVLAVGGFDAERELFGTEDYDMWLRLSQREPIAYLPEALTFYRLHGPGQICNPHLVSGVDRVLDKVGAAYAGEAHFENLVRRRRAEVRVEMAADLLRAGKRDEARTMLAEARKHARTWGGYRTWLRSLFAG
ncbi:MAG: glycosyltransferase family 2 protein [Planctomycetes bacterium]|nr:glycosyltransferase family 2 protein [Planctomycetota bacterium]MCC7064773.1 glycosyltransferase family 2 protein [Planctomycetota bacterium]